MIQKLDGFALQNDNFATFILFWKWSLTREHKLYESENKVRNENILTVARVRGNFETFSGEATIVGLL
jgi:hypothetical protein